MEERILKALEEAKPTEEQLKGRRKILHIRVSEEEYQRIFEYFGSTTYLREFILEAMEVLRLMKKSIDEKGTLLDEEHSTEHQ